ncbi:RNA polymerase sigma factor [Pseudopedobacter beijingensis]|uniref:RNA polymerase sigma factor n=1 Tax=Pseudopedobacter beijingensis TaxID=1207056 RepID=A0ABW4IAQ9_9SPHI
MSLTNSNKPNVLDNEWISEYKNSGDIEALGQLYDPYMPLVYGIALKYFKDEEKSKDAVMNIFEELIIKVKTYEITNFRSWLYTLSKNHCLMELRKEKKHQFFSIDEYEFMEFGDTMHLFEKREKDDRINEVEACMESLSKEQRWSVSLFYLENKCYADVAEATGYDLNKVKSYIQNGKRNLKICLEKKGE